MQSMEEFKRNVTIGQIFRITRIVNDYKMSDLAAFLGISKSAVSLIENARRGVNEKVLNKYLEHFGVERQAFDQVEREVTEILFGKEVDMMKVSFLVVRMLAEAKERAT